MREHEHKPEPTAQHSHVQTSSKNREPLDAGPAGMTGVETFGEEPAADDHTPENIAEDADSHTPSDLFGASASDQDLNVVGPDQIGAGRGLDEAEMGRVKPLDKKPWDGDPSEPL